jgi:superfamily II DNA or RNA helicase
MAMKRHTTWRTLPLWNHQRRAVETIKTYLEGGSHLSALIRMPTGTGKTGVIAVVARCLPTINNVLVVTPWAALREQLKNDLEGRFWSRIGIDPTLWPVDIQMLFPSSIRECLRKSSGKTIFIGTIAALQAAHVGWEADFHELRKKIDLVMVDEGHREPAPKWANAVRGMAKPTVLLTATPYRNDHKLFQVDPQAVYAYHHQKAVDDRFIREVAFHEKDLQASPKSFVAALLRFYKGRFRRLRPNAVAEHRVIVRCQTDSEVNEVATSLQSAGERVVAIHERFTEDEESYAQEVPDPEAEDATFWVHQNKLIEGIDDPRFSLLAIYGPFTNGRSLVQQVGRILRNPSRAPNQTAHVFANVAHRQRAYWDGYRHYEEDFESNPTRREVRQQFFTLIEQQPEYEYIDGTYRERFDVDATDIHLAFKYPLSANVFRVPRGFELEKLTQSLKEEWYEEDLEIIRTQRPGEDICMHVYVTYGNSRLLKDQALVGYNVGFTIYRRYKNLLFFLDSEGNSCEYLLKIAQTVSPVQLQRLFAGKHSRLSQVSLMNMDLGRRAIRRRSVHAYSVSETAPGLTDHIHFCSTAAGHTGSLVESLQRRYVGFTRGRVSDLSTPTADFDAYIDWVDKVAQELSDTTGSDVDLFDRFADFVPPPEETAARNILFDLDEARELYQTKQKKPERLDGDDLCLAIGTETPGQLRWKLNGKEYDVTVSFDEERKKYLLESPKLERAYTRIEGKGQNLVLYLNREQSFRIVPTTPNVIYSHGRFYAPKLRLGGPLRVDKLDLFQILEPIQRLSGLNHEKFPALRNHTGWGNRTVFHLIDTLGRGTELRQLMSGLDVLICDDAGSNENADFIGADTKRRRVILVHAKAARETRLLSASAFADVCSQAVKNLDLLTPFSTIEPPNLHLWESKWRASWNKVEQVVNKRIRLGPRTPGTAWQRLRAIIRDPAATREVWIIVGNTFSREEFRNAASLSNQPPEVIQILYSLQSTWGAVASVGARLRVFCSP